MDYFQFYNDDMRYLTVNSQHTSIFFTRILTVFQEQNCTYIQRNEDSAPQIVQHNISFIKINRIFWHGQGVKNFFCNRTLLVWSMQNTVKQLRKHVMISDVQMRKKELLRQIFWRQVCYRAKVIFLQVPVYYLQCANTNTGSTTVEQMC